VGSGLAGGATPHRPLMGAWAELVLLGVWEGPHGKVPVGSPPCLLAAFLWLRPLVLIPHSLCLQHFWGSSAWAVPSLPSLCFSVSSSGCLSLAVSLSSSLYFFYTVALGSANPLARSPDCTAPRRPFLCPEMGPHFRGARAMPSSSGRPCCP
jgi:hypothetical protein